MGIFRPFYTNDLLLQWRREGQKESRCHLYLRARCEFALGRDVQSLALISRLLDKSSKVYPADDGKTSCRMRRAPRQA
jgi:hypothetical protein